MDRFSPQNQYQIVRRGHIPFVFLSVALLLGIALGGMFLPHKQLYWCAWIIFFGLAVGFVWLLWITRLKSHRYYGLLSLCVLLMIAVTGFIRTWQKHPRIDSSHFSNCKDAVLIGSVADQPVVRGAHVRFPLTVTAVVEDTRLDTEITGQLMVTLKLPDTNNNNISSLRYGDLLVVSGRYDKVAAPYNPGEIDYRRHLAYKGIWHQVYLHSDEVKFLEHGKGNLLVAYALELRQHMIAKFAKYINNRDALSVASTLILGYRADLSAELIQAYANTGTIHVLSVSGMHVVIVFWLLSKLLWWMDRGKLLRSLKVAVLIMAIWAYALVTGFSPSVLRASIMISFVIVAVTYGQQNRIYNSIAASAFFLLLSEPGFIGDIGFQLSYLAVLGIVALMPLLAVFWSTGNRLGKPVMDYIYMSVAAQAGAGPLAAYYFHQFPLYFLPANLIVVIPASLIMYLGFLLLLLPQGMLAGWVGWTLELLIGYTNAALRYMEQLPLSNIKGLWASGWETLVCYACMVALILALVRHSKPWLYSVFACFTILVFSSAYATVSRLAESQVILFNVRHELAIGFIHRGQAWVYSSLPSVDDRTFRYAVKPGLEKYASGDQIRFIGRGQRYVDSDVYVSEPIVQFGACRMLVYDGRQSHKGMLDVEVLLLRNNPKVKLNELFHNIQFAQVVMDGSNADSTISRFTAEATELGKTFHVLKNKPAYRVIWDE